MRDKTQALKEKGAKIHVGLKINAGYKDNEADAVSSESRSRRWTNKFTYLGSIVNKKGDSD